MKTVLTGITTTGTPHLGNYVGAIKPAIAKNKSNKYNSYFFLADLHALIKCWDPAQIAQSTKEIAATWLALGINNDNAMFYRQSDIPEIPELTWLLTCMCSKGLMNRSHAYKAFHSACRARGTSSRFRSTATNFGRIPSSSSRSAIVVPAATSRASSFTVICTEISP